MLNQTINYLKAALIYKKELFVINLFFFISLIVLFNFSNLLSFIFYFVFGLFTILFISYFLGNRRTKEIDKIKKTINAIRNNEIESPDEIKLGVYLSELENDIKSMFFRTQNDILNLKKLEKVRTQFLANVSHELRTPIFAIQGYLETLLDGAINDPKVNNGFLEKALNKSKNLNDLLNDLIDISMIESGEMRLNLIDIELNDFLESTVKEFKTFAEEKGLELILHNIPLNLTVKGDKKRLKQVFANLIQNAMKYTETGKVEVMIEEYETDTKLIVRDTGFGIAEKDLERIFERFYRVDKDRSRAIGGTGLGLAIVKHIVEAHKSKIFVKSEVGKGSEFYFLLKK